MTTSNPVQPTTRIQEIIVEVNNRLDNIQQQSIEVGTLLLEAKEEMLGNGKTASDFLKFCAEQFNVGKAQAYKLIQVATVFNNDDRFKGVAMRVLYDLACNATPDQMDRAADFASTGSLNSGVCNQLLRPDAPKKAEPQAPTETQEAAKQKQDEIEQAINNIPTQTVTDVEPSSPIESEDLTSEIVELREALKQANELIKSLQSEKVSHNNKDNLAMLPQFKKKQAYAVLGLTIEESQKVTAIKKAFRELIKFGYGDGHEAFLILTKAKDSLIADIEANK